MTWFRLAAAGCWRRPLRASVTAAGVAVAVAAAFSVLASQHGYRRSLWHEMDRLGAHILIVPKGCPYDAASLALHGASWPCYLDESFLREVITVPGIASVAPVLMTAFYDAEARHTIYVGVDTNMPALKPGWKIEGAFPNHGQVLAGADVARQLSWRTGDRVSLPGVEGVQAMVSGLLAPTQSSDDAFVFLPLDDAQQAFGHRNELTHVLVRLEDPTRIDSVVAALRSCGAGMHMNVVPMAHLFQTIQSLVNSTRWFLGAATLVAFLAAGAGVGAALLIAVTERTREIGVLRALGASRGDVFRIIWIEALQVCGVGAVMGVVVAFASMRSVEGWLRARLPFTPVGEIVTWEWWIVVSCLAMALALGSVAALLPAWRAANLTPIRAMRENGAAA